VYDRDRKKCVYTYRLNIPRDVLFKVKAELQITPCKFALVQIIINQS
jgi:hypothetical protein